MNKLKFIMIWCLLVGTLMSCGKEGDPEPEAGDLDYFPATAGSNWTYGGVSPYSVRAKGTTTVIDGKTYHVLETTSGSGVQESYLLKENGTYIGRGMDPRMSGVELVFLKEGAAVGEYWIQQHVINGMNAAMKTMVMEKDITKEVGGKTYEHVIKTRLEMTYTYQGMEIGTFITDYYWAKGIGLVLSDFGPQGQVPLMSYEIR